MQDRPSVLVLDDGELSDVRTLLDELGAQVQQLRGGAIPDRVDPPRDLLVTTARRALLTDGWPPPSGKPRLPVKIAFVSEDSNTARQMLRRMDFDFLVRRPVHPEALRLLLMRCLFQGRERRRSPRSPIGYEVSYRSGLWRKAAVLAELSPTGMRLLSKRPIPVGTHVTVKIPQEIGPQGGFSLRCRAVRVDQGRDRGGCPQFVLGLTVVPEDVQGRRSVLELLAALREGPPPLPRPVPATSAHARRETPKPRDNSRQPPEPEPPLEIDEGERRLHQRAAYDHIVVAEDDVAPRVLVGRDLSAGGMLVDPDPDLRPGQKLRLAIYGDAREEPFLVLANVLRNDLDEGVALRFEDLEAEVGERLELLLGSLPAVEALRGEEAASLGTVVSRVVSSTA